MKRKIMEYLKSKSFKAVRVNQEEFELDNGDIFPIPFKLDYTPTIEEFQKFLDNSKEIIQEMIKKNG